MPFLQESVAELMKRENLSERALALSLSKINYVSNQSINDWLKSKHQPRVEHIDSLYLFARRLGHIDLEFYQTP